MTAKKRLRVVDPDERVDVSTVYGAAEHGTELDEMKAIRARIAKVIDDPKTSARDLAALTRRQLEVSKEIRALQLKANGGSHAPTGDEGWDASAI